MYRPTIVPVVLLGSLLCLHGSVRGKDGKKSHPDPASSPAAAQQAARDALARFEKPPKAVKAGIRNWKIRMECLVTVVKAGPAAIPVLLDALKSRSPETRAFAAQALGVLADPSTRAALAQAVGDKEQLVRLHAIKSLGRLGRLEATPRYRQLADKDASANVRFEMTFALTRDDKPSPGVTRKAMSSYDLTRMDGARLGKAAPNFGLTDTSGKTWRLRDFQGKRSVVLVFLQGSS